MCYWHPKRPLNIQALHSVLHASKVWITKRDFYRYWSKEHAETTNYYALYVIFLFLVSFIDYTTGFTEKDQIKNIVMFYFDLLHVLLFRRSNM